MDRDAAYGGTDYRRLTMAQKKHKHKPLPNGMTYADKLAQDRMLREAVERAAYDQTVQVRADIQSQRMLWLCVVSMAEAFGLGPKRVSDFFTSLQSVSEWVEDMTQKNDQQYALDKLRQKAEQVSGISIEYLYEKDILAAKERNEAKGVFFPVLDKEG